ncbi:MAG: hypothetical protein K2X60_10515 [Xanthobacteraceae bacterium]|nr:hypothetical protein [Xanthobacteraceae bacterium]
MKRDEIFNLAIPKAWAGPALAVAMSGLLAGCGGGSMFGSSSGPSSSSSPSLGDRFGQIFGSKSQAVGETAPPPDADEPTCPSVAIRFGASTLAVGLPGKPASGNDLRYQASVIRTARDCNLVAGQVKARVGIQGRVIVGPAGAPPTVDVPMRVALVKEGVTPKVIFTKAFRTTVDIPSGAPNADFSMVAEDIIYPVPPGADGDSYVFYVGFDPEGLKPEPRAKAGKRSKG